MAIGAKKAKFSSAVAQPSGRISVAGTVKGALPFLTRIGSVDVDLAIEVGGLPACPCVALMRRPPCWLASLAASLAARWGGLAGAAGGRPCHAAPAPCCQPTPRPSLAPPRPDPATPQGEVVLVRQTDQPGIIAAVSTEFAKVGDP